MKDAVVASRDYCISHQSPLTYYRGEGEELIIVGELVYRLHTPNLLKSWRASAGKQVYAERLNKLTSTWASPATDGRSRLQFATAGVSQILQAGDVFKALAINDLGDPSHASAAVAGEKMLLVGTRNIYCVGAR